MLDKFSCRTRLHIAAYARSGHVQSIDLKQRKRCPLMIALFDVKAKEACSLLHSHCASTLNLGMSPQEKSCVWLTTRGVQWPSGSSRWALKRKLPRQKMRLEPPQPFARLCCNLQNPPPRTLQPLSLELLTPKNSSTCTCLGLNNTSGVQSRTPHSKLANSMGSIFLRSSDFRGWA